MTYERAAAMTSYVGSYYGRSRIYKAQNETKGAEFDLLRAMIDEIADQFFVETATWSIDRWEQYCALQSNDGDSMEARRQRVISWLQILSPITPLAMRQICESATHTNVEIKENIAPYTFGVYFDFPYYQAMCLHDLCKVIEESKPAHLSPFYSITLYPNIGENLLNSFISIIQTTIVEPLQLKRMESNCTLYTGSFLCTSPSIILFPYHLEAITASYDYIQAATLSIKPKVIINIREDT